MKLRNPMMLCAALLLAALLAACASLGMAPADTLNKKALAAHTTIEGIAKSASLLRSANKLSDTDKQHVVDTLIEAEAGIYIAQTLAKTDINAGMAKIDMSVAVLTALQTYLATKESK